MLYKRNELRPNYPLHVLALSLSLSLAMFSFSFARRILMQ